MPKTKILQLDNVILLLLLLCGMNFQAKFFYFAFGIFILQCLTKTELAYDRMVIVYFAFSVVYAIYGLSAGIMEVVRRLAFLLVYLAGYDSTVSFSVSKITDEDDNGESWLRKCIIIFALGAFLHYFFNMVINIGSTIGRNTIDIWRGEILSATGQAALACPMLGVAVAYVISSAENKKRILPLVAIVIILVYDMMLAGRTLIAMMLADILFCVILYSIYEEDRNQKWRTWGIIIAIILAAFVLYRINIFGIRTFFEKSNLYARFFGAADSMNLAEDQRMYRKGYYLTHMWNYIFGGLHMNSQVGYAHDLLLDCFDEAGIFAEVPLLIIVISSIKNLVCVIKTGCISKSSTILILSFYFCMYMQFFMEPILAGTRWLFAGFCFINGCMNAMLKLYRESDPYELY